MIDVKRQSVTLSIILITRNEEDNIANTIRSTMRAASQASELLSSYEIILVDSDSSDRTVQIASRFPITVFQLSKQYIGVSAGRYVGHKNATGDYLLFLDGDMILYENFVSRAIEYMRKKQNVAGVSGYLTSHFAENHVNMACAQYSVAKFLPGGGAIYRKGILDKVGPFNPWLMGEEEREVGFRIRQRDFELHELNVPMAIHKVKKEKTSMTHRLKYYRGVGQLLRMYWRAPFAIDLIKKYWFHVSILLWIVLGTPITFLSFFGLLHPLLWKVVAVISALGCGAVARVKGEVLLVPRKLIVTLLQSLGILIGLMKKKRTVKAFPPAKLLKKAYVQSED